jgi:hypothetical protein
LSGFPGALGNTIISSFGGGFTSQTYGIFDTGTD